MDSHDGAGSCVVVAPKKGANSGLGFGWLNALGSSAALLLLVTFLTTHAVASDFCVPFPQPPGPEEVCVTGVFPNDLIHVGPGDVVSLPYVEFVNNTNRDMTFTIEVVGDFITSIPHGVTLAPGESASFSYLPILKTDDDAPIGTTVSLTAGWGAFGALQGHDTYSAVRNRPIELVVGPDTDGDGLVDSWEQNGYDPDADGVVDVDLVALGADPLHKDIFVEIDWEAGLPPGKANLDEVREAFALAPINAGGGVNPDGLPGIDVHFDTGTLTDAQGNLVGSPAFAGPLGRGSQIPDGPWTFGKSCYGGLNDGRACDPATNPCDLATPGDGLGVCEVGFYRARAVYFDVFSRRLVFRYVIMNLGAGAGQGQPGGGEIWLGYRNSETLMHEMGHTLNLSHGGPWSDNQVRNCEPNYLSIMNYRYGRILRLDGSTFIDFSPARFVGGARAQAPLDDLMESELPEQALDPLDAEHMMSFVGPPEVCSSLCNGGPNDGRRCSDNAACADPGNPANNGTCGGVAQRFQPCTKDVQCGGGRCGGRNKTSPIGQPIDWNRNGVLGEVVAQNIDGTFTEGNCGNEGFAAELATMTGHDDWSNIRFRFKPAGLPANAPDIPDMEPELTAEQIEDALKSMNTADLAIVKLGPTGPLEAAVPATLAYDLVVTNAGPNFAGTVQAQDVLPSGFTLADMDARCSEPQGGVVDCRTIGFLPGAQTTFSLEIEGTPHCENGLPVPLVNAATVTNVSEYAGADPDPGDNAHTLTTTVVDTTPPQLVVAVSPSRLSPPNHQLVEITITLAATDTCDDQPAIRLVSVVSNEPDNGTGDGDTANDIQGAAIGTADTSIRLRSERSGRGNGRTYTLTYEAEDASGNTTTVSKTVTVPKNRFGNLSTPGGAPHRKSVPLG